LRLRKRLRAWLRGEASRALQLLRARARGQAFACGMMGAALVWLA
jgi:hypothetical protein